MSDAMNDRRKALEEDYFRRQERELIEKMRARMAAEQESQSAAPSLKCPKDEGTLVEIDFEGVKIDLCDQCGGAWLDPGELEALTKKESGGWLNRLWGNSDRK
jgi:hypothetical protein